MRSFAKCRNLATGALLSILLTSYAAARQQHSPAPAHDAGRSIAQPQSRRVLFSRAFVVDDRLSALRHEPDLQSEVIHRLRLGHPVFIINSGKAKADPRFCRVAVTRRTRGWILESALAVQGRAGEDQRIFKLIEHTSDGLDRIALCRLMLERFNQSQLIPRVLLLLGDEADRAAQTLTQRARKRLAEIDGENRNASVRDYFLNDAGLDRYSKLHVVFNFNELTSEYVYDGKAYEEVIRRFPNREEATLARQRIGLVKQKMARRD